MMHPRKSFSIGGGVIAALALIVAAWRQGALSVGSVSLPAVRVGARPVAMAVDARNGHVFVVNGGDMARPGSVSMLDATGRIVLRTSPAGVDPAAIALDARRGRAYVINRGSANGEGMSVGIGSVSVLDTESGRVVRTVSLPVPPRAVATDTRTGRVFVAGGAWGKPGRVDVLDGASGRLLHTVAVDPNPMAVVADERAGHTFVVCAGVYPRLGSVTTLDTRDGHLLRMTTIGHFPLAVTVDGRTGRVFVVNGGDAAGTGNVSVIDAASGRVLRIVAPGPSPSALAVDSRAGRVYVTTNSKSVAVLDARSGSIEGAVPMGAYLSGASGASIAVDERRGRAYIAGADGTRVIDTESGRVRRVAGARGSVVAVDVAGRAFVSDADTAGDDDPKGIAGLVDALLHRTPSHLGLVGAHSPGKVRVLDP